MTLLRRLAGSRSARRTHQVLGSVLEDREGIADPPVLDRTYARPQLGADSAPSRVPLVEAIGKEQRPADPSGPRVCFAQTIDFLCGSSGGCARCAVPRSVQGAHDRSIILLGFSPPLP